MASYSSNALEIVDISNPAAPVHKGSLANGAGGALLNQPISVFVSGNYAYVASFSSNALEIVDLGGSYIANSEIGSLNTDTLQVGNFAQFNQNVLINSGLNVGGNSMFGGSLTVSGSLGSTTQATPALQAIINNRSGSVITDVLSLTHTATGTIANGIGTGLLFRTEFAGTTNASTTATSSARIAALLTDVTASSPQSALSFFTKSGRTDPQERMRLTATGNLGIGSTTPNVRLTVTGTAGSTQDLFTVASSSNRHLFTVKHTGFVGVGTSTPTARFTVIATSTSYAARITNTNPTVNADGLLISLGIANASRAATNRFIDFAQLNGTVFGAITGAFNAVVYSTNAADLAEYFPVHARNQMPQEGEIVSLDPAHDRNVIRATEDTVPFGIVSTNPGFVGNGPICKSGDNLCAKRYDDKHALVSLVGQVPLKVSNENGAIAVGDSITISSEDGVGMKANFGDVAVGYALAATEENDIIATIMVFANLHTAFGMNPDVTLLTDVAGQDASTLTGKTIMDRIVQLVSGFVDGVLHVAGIKTDELCIGETCVDEGRLMEVLIKVGKVVPVPDPQPLPPDETDPPHATEVPQDPPPENGGSTDSPAGTPLTGELPQEADGGSFADESPPEESPLELQP